MLRLAVITVALSVLLVGSADASERVGVVVQKPARYSEILAPADPVGTVLVIHGGGWLRVGAPEVRYEEQEAWRLRSYGWRTVNVDYRPGWRSLRDVVAWYDWTRANFAGPVCVFGRSAGAHLALMLASRRRPDCVIGHGAITDLRAVTGSPEAATLRQDYVQPAFGTQRVTFSPLLWLARPRVRVLLATSTGDRWAQCRHIVRYAGRRLATRAYCLPSGTAGFIHADVTTEALNTQHARERQLLASVAG